MVGGMCVNTVYFVLDVIVMYLVCDKCDGTVLFVVDVLLLHGWL